MRRIQVHVERVVMRLEGPCRRAAGDLLHHGRFDFQEAALVEERRMAFSTFARLTNTSRDVGIREQVDIALPVAQSRHPKGRGIFPAARASPWPGT